MPEPKKTYKYDLQGKFLIEYDSINLAAKKNDMPVTCIREAANSNRVFRNFMWSYQKHNKINPVVKKLFKAVVAHKGSRIIEFESVSECAKFIGCHRSSISQILSPASNMKSVYGWDIQQTPSYNA